MLAVCALTVPTAMTSFSAISWFDRPAVTPLRSGSSAFILHPLEQFRHGWSLVHEYPYEALWLGEGQAFFQYLLSLVGGALGLEGQGLQRQDLDQILGEARACGKFTQAVQQMKRGAVFPLGSQHARHRHEIDQTQGSNLPLRVQPDLLRHARRGGQVALPEPVARPGNLQVRR